MMAEKNRWQIIGQGLAGTCLAWHLWWRGAPFVIMDRGQGGSSRVAAGLINPITGKNFEPSWQLAPWHAEAMTFYQKIEEILGQKFWHPMPILRLAADEKEWLKIFSKSKLEQVQPWIAGSQPAAGDWHHAMLIRGGGWLAVADFLNASKTFFQNAECFQLADHKQSNSRTIWCDGAAGLMTSRYGRHRCAKGEILTIRAVADESHIRVGGGGWMIPIGAGEFRVGSTYEWDVLDENPSAEGIIKLQKTAERLLGSATYEVVDHVAGIRPILRRSMPLLGEMPDGSWMLNALGSKGSLYAPGAAARLATCLCDGTLPDDELNISSYLQLHD